MLHKIKYEFKGYCKSQKKLFKEWYVVSWLKFIKTTFVLEFILCKRNMILEWFRRKIRLVSWSSTNIAAALIRYTVYNNNIRI